MAMFNSFLLVYQRVNHYNNPLNHYNNPLNHYNISLNHYNNPLNHYNISLNHYNISLNLYNNPLNHYNISLNHYNNPLNHYNISLNHYNISLNLYNNPLNHYNISLNHYNKLPEGTVDFQLPCFFAHNKRVNQHITDVKAIMDQGHPIVKLVETPEALSHWAPFWYPLVNIQKTSNVINLCWPCYSWPLSFSDIFNSKSPIDTLW